MTEVTSATPITASELRNAAAQAKVAGTKRNFRNDPAYKAAYAAEMKAQGKKAAHERYKIEGVAAKIAKADVAKKFAAKAAKASA